MNNIQEYIKDGITINKLKDGGYEVFTIPTQHFKIKDLSELTPETFEKAIAEQVDLCHLESKLFKEALGETEELRHLESRIFEKMLENFGN